MVEEYTDKKIHTRISKGFQVVVPSELRRRYEVSVGDDVLWEISKKGISVRLQKRPSLIGIIALGRSGTRSNSVKLKKSIQKGDV
jgi:bifunctional DNA-binding transcriptional regulator/antitoxin component of YhaV-PrlF toxin-antitoxin module